MMVRRNVHLFVGSLAVTVSIWKLFPGRFFECTRTWGSMSIAALCTVDGSGQVGSSCLAGQTDLEACISATIWHCRHPFRSSLPECWIWWVRRFALVMISQLWIWWLSAKWWLMYWQCQVQSFTALQICSCSLTPAVSFHLVLMSYHEKA